MGRRKLSESERASKRSAFRCTEEEFQELLEAASHSEQSLSDFVREHAVKAARRINKKHEADES